MNNLNLNLLGSINLYEETYRSGWFLAYPWTGYSTTWNKEGLFRWHYEPSNTVLFDYPYQPKEKIPVWNYATPSLQGNITGPIHPYGSSWVGGVGAIFKELYEQSALVIEYDNEFRKDGRIHRRHSANYFGFYGDTHMDLGEFGTNISNFNIAIQIVIDASPRISSTSDGHHQIPYTNTSIGKEHVLINRPLSYQMGLIYDGKDSNNNLKFKVYCDLWSSSFIKTRYCSASRNLFNENNSSTKSYPNLLTFSKSGSSLKIYEGQGGTSGSYTLIKSSTSAPSTLNSLTSTYYWGNPTTIGRGGFDDWFLPSRDEIQLMRNNLYAWSVGNFSQWSYWTSSESGSFYGTSFKFGSNSFSGNYIKNQYALKVRPIRIFRAPNGKYGLRSTGPAGGHIFYMTPEAPGYQMYYECAPSDATSSYWSNSTGLVGVADDIGYGRSNTDLIADQYYGSSSSAAKTCKDLCTNPNYLVGSVKSVHVWTQGFSTDQVDFSYKIHNDSGDTNMHGSYFDVYPFTPLTPTNLSGTVNSNQVQLSWTDPNVNYGGFTNESSFEIWRSINGAAATKLTTKSANSTTHVDTVSQTNQSQSVRYLVRSVLTIPGSTYSGQNAGFLPALEEAQTNYGIKEGKFSNDINVTIPAAAGENLVVSPNTVYDYSGYGTPSSDITISGINSGTTWSVGYSPAWVSIYPSYGNGGGQLSISLSSNTTGNIRSCQVIVSSTSAGSDTFTIIQYPQ